MGLLGWYWLFRKPKEVAAPPVVTVTSPAAEMASNDDPGFDADASSSSSQNGSLAPVSPPLSDSEMDDTDHDR